MLVSQPSWSFSKESDIMYCCIIKRYNYLNGLLDLVCYLTE
jgi:hypothetical protein